MNGRSHRIVFEHAGVTRRWLLTQGAIGLAALGSHRVALAEDPKSTLLSDAIDRLESYFTLAEDFRDVSRGKPLPHRLPDETKQAVGLTRDSWRLEVISDPDHPAKIENPLTLENGKALDFAALLQLVEKNTARFAKVMTCLNIGCPLGTGIWEGVPLRDVLWLTRPTEDLRRVFYYGYHNDDPAQMFRSSLPVGRILEDPFDLPPVILCTKLNGQWLSSERGGPVRVIVPEAYGFKSIKWLTKVVLTNLSHANDTYAEKNNDVDSPLKSFAATLEFPEKIAADTPFAITGYAQSGISGVRGVQVWLHREGDAMPTDREYFSDAPWQEADIMPPPEDWGGDLPDGRIPQKTLGFDASGEPEQWPMRLAKAHWAYLAPGLPAGNYILRCRTIDEKGAAQPMPRPFRKSGHAAIEQQRIQVQA